MIFANANAAIDHRSYFLCFSIRRKTSAVDVDTATGQSRNNNDRKYRRGILDEGVDYGGQSIPKQRHGQPGRGGKSAKPFSSAMLDKESITAIVAERGQAAIL